VGDQAVGSVGGKASGVKPGETARPRRAKLPCGQSHKRGQRPGGKESCWGNLSGGSPRMLEPLECKPLGLPSSQGAACWGAN
jgi:hypothetical protein